MQRARPNKTERSRNKRVRQSIVPDSSPAAALHRHRHRYAGACAHTATAKRMRHETHFLRPDGETAKRGMPKKKRPMESARASATRRSPRYTPRTTTTPRSWRQAHQQLRRNPKGLRPRPFGGASSWPTCNPLSTPVPFPRKDTHFAAFPRSTSRARARPRGRADRGSDATRTAWIKRNPDRSRDRDHGKHTGICANRLNDTTYLPVSL